jgi:hypothetical protein
MFPSVSEVSGVTTETPSLFSRLPPLLAAPKNLSTAGNDALTRFAKA